MSRKKRVLRRLHLVESDLQKTAKTNSKAMWGVVSKGLIAARDIWQEGLTEKTYLAYGEIYDGLILASQQMAASEEKSIEADTISLCRELLQYLIGQTEKETAIKKDIVFLPYKASMWDSLESIWKAAAADTEHCHAYVVPIPYADRNPDGTAKEWHNEKDLFPSYVPTLDCETFDLEALHPDVIFIHNPYDACNRVTSIDSRFYSDKIKKYTNNLVYVPYFVTGGETISNHFCKTPGVINADYVVCENEKIKEIYVQNLKEIEPCPDNKFLALGSPKYDKVVLARKEDYPIPEEWSKIISGRKVILYNTSLSAQLQNPQQSIGKLMSVLQYFREKHDFAFWWRPHPLMEAVFCSMIPQLADSYRIICKRFISGGWGIYDDTPEMDRAIVWSDAYYGDGSSIVHLYKKTGKPIILQALEIKN